VKGWLIIDPVLVTIRNPGHALQGITTGSKRLRFSRSNIGFHFSLQVSRDKKRRPPEVSPTVSFIKPEPGGLA